MSAETHSSTNVPALEALASTAAKVTSTPVASSVDGTSISLYVLYSLISQRNFIKYFSPFVWYLFSSDLVVSSGTAQPAPPSPQGSPLDAAHSSKSVDAVTLAIRVHSSSATIYFLF